MAKHGIPEVYALPSSQLPHLHQPPPSNLLPVIDLSSLHDPSLRSSIVTQVESACKKFGIFQFGLVGSQHGIPNSVMKDALAASSEFFDIPNEEKMKLASSNVYEPVRYGTSHNFGDYKIRYWRDFIKHYAHPLPSFTHLWPSNPPTYKEKMGTYAKAAHMLQKQITELVFESLGLSPNYMSNEIEGGCQCIAVNCYHPCPQPELALGLPAHTDHGTMTILLQNQQGLEMMDHDNQEWHSVPFVEGSLVVQLGDQLEILSNGRYRAVMHRAVLNSASRRISIASVHSFALEQKVSPAPKIVNEDQVLRYKEGCFLEFLDLISGKFGKDIVKERYIDILKTARA